MVALPFTLLLITAGCQPKRDPNAAPVIYSVSEYNEQLAKVEKLAGPIVEKFYAGEPITDGDKDTMRQAKLIWQELSRFNPTKYSVYFGAGQAAFIAEEYSESIRFLESAVNYAPKQAEEGEVKIIAEAFDLISRASFSIGRFDQAVTASKEAVERAPGVAGYLHSEAQALGQVGKAKEAVALLNEALAIDPSHQRSKTLLRFLTAPEKSTQGDRTGSGKSR